MIMWTRSPNNEYYFLKYMSRIINDANAYINGNQVNATWKQKVEGWCFWYVNHEI